MDQPPELNSVFSHWHGFCSQEAIVGHGKKCLSIERSFQMNKILYFLGMVLFLLAIFPENVLSSDSCKISNSKKASLPGEKKTRSLEELYTQTKDKQVESIIQELDVIMPQVEAFWNEVRKRRVVNGVFSEDSDEFIKAIAWKKDFGMTWHQTNFGIVEEARKIFNAHPCLKRISITKDAMVLCLQKHKKRNYSCLLYRQCRYA
jgi:hypothetical protein